MIDIIRSTGNDGWVDEVKASLTGGTIEAWVDKLSSVITTHIAS